MTGLNNVFDQFSTSPELEIPVRVTDRAATARKDFEASEKSYNCEKKPQRSKVLFFP